MAPETDTGNRSGARENATAKTIVQDDWTCPRLTVWQDRLDEALEASDGVWIVAHSLGCILAANLADRPTVRKVRGALLVAPCDLEKVEELHPCIVNFGEKPTRALPFPSMIVASRNDPYMSFETARRCANLWAASSPIWAMSAISTSSAGTAAGRLAISC